MSPSVTNKLGPTNLSIAALPVKRPPPVPSSLPNVFDYQDYRAYLRDVVLAKRREDSAYSLAKFAKAVGFSSHSGLAMVLSEKRDLKDPYLEKCSRHLKHSFKQRLYFEAMVRAGKLGPEKRRKLLREMEFHTSTWEPPEASEGIRMLDFGVIQQVLTLHRGFLSREKILSHFRYEISSREVERILSWMKEKKYVEEGPEGFRVNRSVMLLPDEIPNASGKQFHRDCMKLAGYSLEEDALEDREFQTYLLTVDSRRIPEMKRKIKKMVIEALSEFEDELDGDTVAQVHFNLFEVTKRMKNLDSDGRQS